MADKILMAAPTSSELIERWIGGDREAARQIFDKYYRRAWKFGLSITKREVEADELAQAALAHGLEVVRDATRRPARFTGWLLGVVKHLAWRRTDRHRQPLPGETRLEDTRHGRPSGPMIEKEMAALVTRALEALPGDEREIVEERFIRGTARGEIAKRIGCSVDTVDRRLKSATARLRAFLSGHFTTMILSGAAPTLERVMELRPSFRAAFLARHVDGLSAENAAAKLGIPPATLEERLQYAYQILGCTERSDFSALRRPV
ncbi:MAG TPA: sigma-70 family RNA polymerase sigma factor [Planctomycetota bacterium]|nr:sigma-70 family RNA polymerase sigma factor [Planctomycetota bacterium]